MINALITAGFAFLLVKYGFEFLGWLTMEGSDKIYRQHLDSLFDSFNKYNMYDLAFLIAGRIASRLRLANLRVFVPAVFLLILFVFVTNYAAMLISFSVMAKSNVNFAFSDRSIREIAWALFRELGFTGSQQMIWILGGSSLSSLCCLFISRKLLLATKRSSTAWQLVSVIAKQVGVFIIACAVPLAFIFLSVRLYDWDSNTETQQYLYTQTVRMLYYGEQPITFVLLINTIASSLPSALFLLLFLFLAVLKVIPDIVRRGIVHFIMLVSMGNKPVLSQVASLFGVLTALTAALLNFIGK